MTLTLREWGPVGVWASVLGAVLVWLGITGCGLAYPGAAVALMGAAGGGGGSGPSEEPLVVPEQYAATTEGLVGVIFGFDDSGGVFVPVCTTEPVAAFDGENVLQAMQIVYGPDRNDFQWLAIIRAPDPEEPAALKRALADGTEIDSIDLPFAGSFDVDTERWTVYVAEDDGGDIAVVDLRTGTVHLQERSGGVHVERAGDLRIVNGATWVSDNANGSIVISGRVEEFPERIMLEPGSHVSIDYVPGSTLVHAVTSSGLWEVDVATREPTLVGDVDGGGTISSDEAGNVGLTARANDGSFAAYMRLPGGLDGVELQRFNWGWVPRRPGPPPSP